MQVACSVDAAGELHRSFVGRRPLSRTTPLPQDDKSKLGLRHGEGARTES